MRNSYTSLIIRLQFFIVLVLVLSLSVNAQVPGYPHYIQQYPYNSETESFLGFYDFFTQWDENNPMVTEDDNFYISRVPLAQRFEDASTQFNSDLTPQRKVLWWCPAGVSDKYWSSLPRYIFNADAFSCWSMIDVHGNWADGLGRVPAALSDAAHLNGVQNGCVMFWDTELNSDNDYWKFFNDLNRKDADGDYYNCRKFIRFLRYYGIDGIGINPEGNAFKMAGVIKDVLERLHLIALEEGWHFRVDWYDSLNNSGNVQYANALKATNSEWFQRSNRDYPVSDVFFLNYNWGRSHLQSSQDRAEKLGRSPYDVYAGFDIQGRGLSSDLNQPSDARGWNLLSEFEISIGIWGAHGKNMLYENSNEFGSSQLAIQNMYQRKQEQFFFSGTRNLLTAPEITNSVKSYGTKNMEKFHGIAKLTPARSTLTTLPFVTYFNLGNGQRLWDEGREVFSQPWYNLASQTILPTWRWWICGKTSVYPSTNQDQGGFSEKETQKLVNVQLSYDKAWKGGSSLRINGETDYSEIRLFKTQYELNGNETIAIRYSLPSGNAAKNHSNNPLDDSNYSSGNIYIIWSPDGKSINRYPILANAKENAEFNSKECASINTSVADGDWVKFESTTNAINMTGPVKMIGLAIENMDKDFDLYIGEISLNDNKPFKPVAPDITSSKLLRQAYNSVDFKLVWNSTPTEADNKEGSYNKRKPWIPVYNKDVDTWYFEVLMQENGEDPILLNTTTSWASYVVSAPISEDIASQIRFGVRAVAPDGKTRSEISWSDYMTRNPEEMVVDESLSIDQSKLNPGDKFTIAFYDPYHPQSHFKIINAATAETVFSSENPTNSITTTLDEIGIYDLVVGETKYSSMIHITPSNTGAFPIIEDLLVLNSEPDNEIEDVISELTLKYQTPETSFSDKSEDGFDSGNTPTINVDQKFALVMTGRKGEGNVSKGLVLQDPVMLRFSPQMCSEPDFTIAFWVKPTQWAHGRFGTNLLNKRSLNAHWPHNNWGTLWCHIWPESPVCQGQNPNTLSMTQFGNTKVNYPQGVFPNGTHEGPNMGCMANDVSMRLDSWYHVAFSVAQDKMSMFVNGRLIATQQVDWATNSNGDKDPTKNQYVYIGGSNVYHGGLIGVIDDVQYWDVYTDDPSMVSNMMKGYYGRDIPEHLMGYWDFEESGGSDSAIKANNIPTSSTARNRGHNQDLIAQTVYLTAAGGEDTSEAETVFVEMDNSSLGYPGLEGTLKVGTETSFDYSDDLVCNSVKKEDNEEDNEEGGKETEKEDGQKALVIEENTNGVSGDVISIEYFTALTSGSKTITAGLENLFGSDSKELDLIVVDKVEGLENSTIENSITLQPHRDYFVICFANAGNYSIEVHSVSGQLLCRQTKNIEANSFTRINFESDFKVYIVSVRDQKTGALISWKIIR